MTHLTLNTRHAGTIPAGMVTAETLKLLSPLIKRGGGKLPGMASAYVVQIFRACQGGGIYTFSRAGQPLSTNGWARTDSAAEVVWPKLEKLWLQVGDEHPQIDIAPNQPLPDAPAAPWIATVMLFGLAAEPTDMVGFIGHMAACFGVLLNHGQ